MALAASGWQEGCGKPSYKAQNSPSQPRILWPQTSTGSRQRNPAFDLKSQAVLSFEVNVMMYLFLQFREILSASLMTNFR